MKIKRNFYDRNTIQVAKDLLGCFLARKYKGKIIKVMITETEAYRGEYDLASHASRGRTARTEIMYGRPGHAYVYMIYGMYFMLNIVTEKENFPAAVLIRGVQIVKNSKLKIKNSNTDGPGKLTKYLHIERSLNGHDLTRSQKLWLEPRENKKRLKIIESPRIGVGYAKQSKEWKWNFRIIHS
jgi:DNA-3-methyladenine glycosylase